MEQANQALSRLYTAKLRWEDMAGEGEASDKMREAVSRARATFVESMDTDLNTAGAIGALFELVRAANYLLDEGGCAADAAQALAAFNEMSEVMGILYRDMTVLPEEVAEIASRRADARAQKNWALSDELRDRITAMGYTVEDTAEGQKVKKK
jgi:cysteinyl-tRNA synthetase